MTADQAAEHRFAVFAAPKWGFRALATVLLNYEHLHGLNTIRQIIGRWAPPNENNTIAYVKAVCDGVGADPNTPLDLHDPATLQKLAKAISIHEAGSWMFKQEDLIAGVKLALKNGD